MKRTLLNRALLTLPCLLLGCLGSQAIGAELKLSATSAPAGGSSAAVVSIAGLSDPSDIESFTLTLSFSSGTLLTLASTGWFSRYEYFPSRPFGPVPQVERNHITPDASQTKVFINGFDPFEASGNIGVVTFNVDSGAVDGDTQVLSLSGQYLSKSTGQVETFPTVTATFTVGSYAIPGTGDVNNDGVIDLVDAIYALQVVTGMSPAQTIYPDADVNSDNKIGMQEVIYILQKVSKQR